MKIWFVQEWQKFSLTAFTMVYFFSPNPNRIAPAFKYMFVLEHFFVAIDGDRVMGMVGCANTKELSGHLNGKELRKHFDRYKGSLALLFLKKEFHISFHSSMKSKTR